MRPMFTAALALFALPALALTSMDSQAGFPAPDGAVVLDSGAWVLRVGGDAEAELVEREGPEGQLYRAGRVLTDTKLPVGYPPPTPPGAIEIKHYPSVRRAEFGGAGGPGLMGQRGFWPLFRHISRNDIAMTAPVEMEYTPARDDGTAPRWTMAFLYHTPEDGPTGEDGPVRVVDTEAQTVLSIGVRGRRGWTGVAALADRLDAWLDETPGWQRVGDARTLGYNGPNVPIPDQWWEVQVPIERAE